MAANMKPLPLRIPEMLAKREKTLNKRREDIAKSQVEECSFTPTRESAVMTEKLLKRIGREKVTPADLTKYHDEKRLRNDQRRAIIEEVESRELTFKPRINIKSQKIEQKLQMSNTYTVDPKTRTRSSTVTKISELQSNVAEGPTLILESDHPYQNNVNDFSLVCIPGAICYTITFDEKTATEPIHDHIKFYRDEKHIDFYGAKLYSGGLSGGTSNWPGIGDRPPLVIQANKFIVHFKSNGTVNGWGFRMKVVPLIRLSDADNDSIHSGQPQISAIGKLYKSTRSTSEAGAGQVHERLYTSGMERLNDHRDFLNEKMSSKLNVTLKHWEGGDKPIVKGKLGSTVFEDVTVVDSPDDSTLVIVEYHDDSNFIWKSINNATNY